MINYNDLMLIFYNKLKYIIEVYISIMQAIYVVK